MTEEEWLACANPGLLLEYLRGKASDRKLRLFAVACCWRVSDLMIVKVAKNVLRMAETYADGGIPHKDFYRAGRCFSHMDWNNKPSSMLNSHDDSYGAASWALNTGPMGRPANMAARCAAYARRDPGTGLAEQEAAEEAERVIQAALLRDIIGPLPFRPVTVYPNVLAWNDRLVVRLAQTIYDERRWGDLGVLHDALLDAGCDNEDMLSHAREQGSVHHRGCWLLDVLLNKG